MTDAEWLRLFIEAGEDLDGLMYRLTPLHEQKLLAIADTLDAAREAIISADNLLSWSTSLLGAGEVRKKLNVALAKLDGEK